jgi:hypothetical protein
MIANATLLLDKSHRDRDCAYRQTLSVSGQNIRPLLFNLN